MIPMYLVPHRPSVTMSCKFIFNLVLSLRIYKMFEDVYTI